MISSLMIDIWILFGKSMDTSNVNEGLVESIQDYVIDASCHLCWCAHKPSSVDSIA